MKTKINELWQYRFVLSNDWATDTRAMNNPKFKSFSDYQKHTEKLNKKFMGKIECRLITI